MKKVIYILTLTLLMPTITIATTWEWNRQSNWVSQPASDQGTTNGNPALDSYGLTSWSYEYTVDGGSLSSSNPWYAKDTAKMVWDSLWFSTEESVWAMSDNTVPVIFSEWLTQHNYKWNTCPIVRWTNLTGQNLLMNIQGTLQLGWLNNEYTSNYSVPVDIALAKLEAQSGATQLLLGTTQVITRGIDMSISYGSSIMIDFQTQMNAGDQLIVSLRAAWDYPGHEGRWVDLHDNLTLSAVPEPTTLSLLGLGLIALRRKK